MIAVGVDLRQIHRRHDLLTRRPRLHQLLVDFRRIDVGQQLALLHVRCRCLCTSAADSRWYARRSETRHKPAKCPAAPVLRQASRRWDGRQHRGDGVLIVVSASTRLSCTRISMVTAPGQHQQQHDHADNEQGLARGRRRQLRRRSDCRRSMVSAAVCRWRSRFSSLLQCSDAICIVVLGYLQYLYDCSLLPFASRRP